eukprot:216418-Pyramimonas_sp.AAC.1
MPGAAAANFCWEKDSRLASRPGRASPVPKRARPRRRLRAQEVRGGGRPIAGFCHERGEGRGRLYDARQPVALRQFAPRPPWGPRQRQAGRLGERRTRR